MARLMALHRVNGHADAHSTDPCAHPECAHTLERGAWRGHRTGKLYCSRYCRAEMSDDPNPEDIARTVN